MIAIFAIIAFTVYLTFFFPVESREREEEEKSAKYNLQMKKLWSIAQTSMKERKPFRAEKALLTILKFDEKNAAAYNRLGILYAKSKKYDEAVECFEIAQSLDNNPASIHNAGLIYLEVEAYEKAALAFQQAIALEGDVPERYIALARAEEKLGRPKKAVEALENAYELDPKITTLKQILAIYETDGDVEAATATSARIEAQIAREAEVKRKRAMDRALKVMRTNGKGGGKGSRLKSRGKTNSNAVVSMNGKSVRKPERAEARSRMALKKTNKMPKMKVAKSHGVEKGGSKMPKMKTAKPYRVSKKKM